MIICSWSDKVLIVIEVGATAEKRNAFAEVQMCFRFIDKNKRKFQFRYQNWPVIFKFIQIKQACDIAVIVLSISLRSANSWKC